MNNQISIVIISWNAKKYLKECLHSVYKNTRNLSIETIVVDNASSDGTLEMIELEFPRVHLIKNTQNAGYASGNNTALKFILNQRTSAFVLLLNQDTELKGQAVEKMKTYLMDNPEVGAVGPALVLPNTRLQTGAAGYLPSAQTGLNYFLFLSKLFPRKKGLFIDQSYFVRKKKPVDVDWISGACLMTRLDVIENVGLLDETYLFTVEDIDWGKRIKQAGYALHYLPGISVLHHHGTSHRETLVRINTEWLSMLFLYIQREKGLLQYFIFRFFAICGFFLRFLVYSFAAFFSKDSCYKIKRKEMFRYLAAALSRKEVGSTEI